MNLLSGIWVKVTGVLALIIGVLVLRGKQQANKIEDLKHESKKSEIKAEAAVNKAKILADEQEEILTLVKETHEKPTIDELNNM